MWSVWIVGSSAWTNQSETNADAVPAAASSASAAAAPTRAAPLRLTTPRIAGTGATTTPYMTQDRPRADDRDRPGVVAAGSFPSPTSTMMNVATSSNVAVSFGSRGLNRMIPSSARRAPATITRPSTNSAFTRIEPTIAVCATTNWPALSAKITTKNSGRLATVACSTPVIAGPTRSPTCSVANDTIQAVPANATVASTNAPTCEKPLA